MKPKREGRGELYFIALCCGVVPLLVGLLAAGVSVFDPPPDHVERVTAAAVAVMGVVFGIGFISIALPSAGTQPAGCGARSAGSHRSPSCRSRPSC